MFPEDDQVVELLKRKREYTGSWSYGLFTIPISAWWPILSREKEHDPSMPDINTKVGFAILPYLEGDPNMIVCSKVHDDTLTRADGDGFASNTWHTARDPRWLVAKEVMDANGYIGMVEEESLPEGTIRVISATNIDFPLLKDILQACLSNHRSRSCSAEGSLLKLPAVDNLWLVDCKAKALVKAKDLDFPPYLALSYVWGKDPLIIHDSLQNPPRTIADAIVVTLELGFQYLWIDKFCIPQNDSEEKLKQIKLMGSIYRSAQATIFAAAGTNPQYGLPGVSCPRTVVQHILPFKDYKLANCLPNSRHAIHHSEWDQRGWTYQEALLSGCKLFFTKEQFFYHCDRMYAYESMSGVIDSVKERHSDIFTTPFPSQRGSYSAWDIMRRVENYTRRQLTWQSDILNAFQGVLQIFNATKAPLRTIYGIPILPRPIQASPADYMLVDGPKVHWETTNSGLLYGFVLGLLWRFQDRIERPESQYPGYKRREGFPSWSWAGWDRGDSFFTAWDPDTFAWDNLPLSISFQTKGGENVEFDDFPDSWDMDNLDGSHLKPCLTLSCWTIELRRVNHGWVGIHDEQTFNVTPDFLCDSDTVQNGKYLAVRIGHLFQRPRFLDDDQEARNEAATLYNMHHLFGQELRVSQRPQFVLYGCTSYIVMKEKDGQWERVGLIAERVDPFFPARRDTDEYMVPGGCGLPAEVSFFANPPVVGECDSFPRCSHMTLTPRVLEII